MPQKNFSGIVRAGRGRAARLGFPTVNIALSDTEVSGIFAATVRADGTTYRAAAFADPARGVLEAHLLDFSGDLYGREVAIELKKKLRESASFSDDAALARAIANDTLLARRYFDAA